MPSGCGQRSSGPREIGRFRDTGLRRLALSREDKEVRDLFVGWAREAGCAVEVDPVGNIFARRPGTDNSLPPVAIGSHLDTQICGGRYDGVLGVMCGLEAIRTLNDRGIANAPADRADHVDQRGRRPLQPAADGVAGVRRQAARRAGARHARTTPAFASATNSSGSAMPARRRSATARSTATWSCTSSRRRISTARAAISASSSAATRRSPCASTSQGETSHSGGTPMPERRNALVGAGYLIAAVNDIGLAYRARSRGAPRRRASNAFPTCPASFPSRSG